MEPISALSLACNVLQLVEQAIEAAKVCKELYERGSLDENNEIERYAEGLTALNNDVEAVLKQHPATTPSRASKLQAIANDASKTAVELKKVLNQLKLSKKQGIRAKGGAFLMTLRSIWKKGTIDKLRVKLEDQDAALQSGLMKDI
ncbi:uncharacterized protein PV07_07559 [Cladophialophora immunda]|uniref:NACHT-NTPase and P-loop NTPases N-terminal domain-containing protein n=1 Tax=Cladophialophora immunda TaxID=569365 RepID=A0A0D2C9V7_9EURO|nr:uncharacterized protein PV07_07559 [Cladophialophora immunda]KIW27858.1 hypothetical protein PV07_07559 [Cladophialophora immunda]